MIDYRKIVAAIDYYEKHGFELIEVPWCVVPEAKLATLPKHIDRKQTETVWGDLIGSAEQGFIDMMIDSLMPFGRYMAVSPCFRIERQYSELTRPWFMKLELIDYMPKSPAQSRDELLQLSLEFFRRYIDTTVEVMGDGMFDIVTLDPVIELGSYGTRIFGNHEWAYGTGIAEPRLSTSIELSRRQ